MPFEKGNKYGGARKVKPFRDALMMEIAGAGDDHKTLRKIAAALLAKAAGGDVPAINSLADRTDGKVAQALIGDSQEDGVRLVHTITRKIVEQEAADAQSVKPTNDHRRQRQCVRLSQRKTALNARVA